MSAGLISRAVAVLRRGDLLPGPAPLPAVAGDGRSHARRAEDLDARATLREIADAVPGLREEVIDRSRIAGLLVGWVAVLAMPLWALVDRAVTPEQAGMFLVARLLCDVPMALALWALWRTSLGRRRPEALTFLILAVVQVGIAWMITQADDPRYHLLGLTLAIYGSGCILVAPPRWTVALVGVTWAALGLAMLTSPDQLGAGDLVAVTCYLATASAIALLTHRRRNALDKREMLTRVRLEREQQRTGVLLARLERLSNEDPLTGLANRRRWDAELVAACTTARQTGRAVAVVLLDIDHFKTINDRHGHPGGDEALRQVAGLLSARVRGEDVVARLGGDEFAVLLPAAGLRQAIDLAERLRTEAGQLLPAGFGAGELSISLGVASAAGNGAYPLELMSQADEQLYRAKITRNAVGAPALELSGAALLGTSP